MSARIFKNKICKVKTRTVKPLLPSGKGTMPEDFWYSVVDYIYSVELVGNCHEE